MKDDSSGFVPQSWRYLLAPGMTFVYIVGIIVSGHVKYGNGGYMNEVAGNAKLSNLEKVRRFAISPEPFTISNSLMTPTLKIRRHKIRAAYGKMLEELY